MNAPEVSASASVTRCGFVAIVGRPNVGKSTLFNRLVRVHLSPVTPKPQTTRCNIRGILSSERCQMIWVDTPGLHQRIYRPLNRVLNDNVRCALSEVDAVLMMTVRSTWLREDELVLEQIRATDKPCLLVMNKMDLIADKSRILAMIEEARVRHPFREIFPLSALKDAHFDALQRAVAALLPAREFIFADDQLSDQSERFLAGEMIREQAMRELHQELPYLMHVRIDQFKEQAKTIHVHATLFSEKEHQRPIVIGHGGEKLKRISTRARRNLESLLGRRVYLRVWVRAKKDLWRKDAQSISLSSRLRGERDLG